MSYGYVRRNQRIREEATKIAQRNIALEAEKEKYAKHHAEQARLADIPYSGMVKDGSN
jgi:hypothetical protein